MASDIIILVSYAGAALAVLLACTVLYMKGAKTAWLLFAFGMVLVAADAVLGACVLDAVTVSDVEFYQRLKYLLATLLPGAWVAFSASYSRADGKESIKRYRWIIATLVLVSAGAVLGFPNELLMAVLSQQGGVVIALGWAGKILNLCVLLGTILVLVNFERTFRSATGTMRWRIKYLVFGVGIIFGAKVYVSSQALLYSTIQILTIQINSCAILLGGCLIGYSFFRTRLAESEIYPSQKVLQQSITIIIVGAYLVMVGGLAKLVVKV
ncbi:MAG: zraS 6, partial [Verrucomicrobiales bacterium]|nr:zraS 6 [Verrucomicrobiales bacterium]